MSKEKFTRKQKFESLEIEEQFLETNSKQSQSKARKKLFFLASLPSIGLVTTFICYMVINYFYPLNHDQNKYDLSEVDKIGHYIAYTGVFLMLVGFAIINFKLSRENSLIDREVRKLWRQFYWCLCIYSLITIIGLSMYSSFFHFSDMSYLFYIMVILILLTSSAYLIVFYNPILLLNRPLMLFADFIRSTLIIPFIWMPFVYLFPDLEYSYLTIIIYLTITMLLQIILSEFSRSRLLPFQKTVVRFVDSNLLSKQIIEKFNENESYSYLSSKLRELQKDRSIEELTKQNEQIIKQLYIKVHSRDKSLKYLALTLLSFLIGAIGEGLIQDLFNENIKKFLCEHLNMFC